MSASAIDLLARLTAAISFAIVLALLLRPLVRSRFGAGAAYQLWLVVPSALMAALLPAIAIKPVVVLPSLALLPLPAIPGPIPAQQLVDGIDLAIAAWAAGACVTLALFVIAHRRYLRRLGALHQQGDLFIAGSALEGPVLLGLWRPKVVLPADFSTRYSDAEQALIIAHEQQHARRRDPLANTLIAALQCVFWFNPLLHFAAGRCRFDQELACDADVLAADVSQRQAYASAMLKTQFSGAPALATCHWQSTHPLKERIMNLKQSTPSRTRRYAGRLAVAVLAGACMLATVAVRANTSAKADKYEISVRFAEGEGNTVAGLPVSAGEDIALNWKQPGAAGWEGVFRIEPASDQAVFVRMNITQDNGELITPTLMLKLGENGAVKATDKDGKPTFAVGLTVKRAAAVN